MIVIDTSALVAIRKDEPDASRYRDAIDRVEHRIVPSPCYLEFVLVRREDAMRRDWLDRLLARHAIGLASVDEHVIGLAADAAERYGRGSGHRAKLNFGDCLSYAVAKRLDAPLLYKGDDFIHTDVRSALSP